MSVRRIEPAHHIAERDQTVRKPVECLEAPAHAARKAEAVNRADGLCSRNGLMDRLRSQRPGEPDEVSKVLWDRLTMHVSQVDLPTVVLDWNEQPATTALGV